MATLPPVQPLVLPSGSGTTHTQTVGAAGSGTPAYCGDVEYPGGNGNHMTICNPGGSADRPMLLLVHGGGWVGGARDAMGWWMLKGFQAGAAVATIDYTDGASMGQIYGEVLAGAKVLELFSGFLGFNASKLGCIGFSAGGHLVMLLATANGGSLCKATSSLSGPTDMIDLYVRTSDDVRGDIQQVMGAPASFSDPNYLLFSPLVQLKTSGQHLGHIQQIFSTTDSIVPPADAIQFHDVMEPKAKMFGVQNVLDLVPGGTSLGHGFTFPDQFVPQIQKQITWTIAALQ
jgi:acetyl esterase/lipase